LDNAAKLVIVIEEVLASLVPYVTLKKVSTESRKISYGEDE
jgi:hypothetical protein